MIAICIKEGLEQLTKGFSYEVSETPVMYDPNTFEPAPTHYVVLCNDKKTRLFARDGNFIELDKWREDKLNQLGI